MLASPQKKVLVNSTPLYEENYQRLKACFPSVHKIDFAEAVNDNETLVLRFQVDERFKYTSTVTLTLGPVNPNPCLPSCELQLRLYHDARLVEVVTCQGERHLLPHYDYPNEKMYQRNEKHLVNQLLRDVLIYCQRTRFRLLECTPSPV